MHKPKVAVIGSGISGLLTSWLLQEQANVILFEKNSRLGGHTYTKSIKLTSGESFDVDMGFIVFNHKTYPLLTKWFEKLNIDSIESEMSFSVKCSKTGLEYNGTNLNGLFSQRKNLFSPSFYNFIINILKFNKLCLSENIYTNSNNMTIGDLIKNQKLSENFCKYYLLPMTGAIWSSAPENMLKMPLTTFIDFFRNHGLLQITNRPTWRVVKGGSSQYIKAWQQNYSGEVFTSSKVLSIKTNNNQNKNKKYTIYTEKSSTDVDNIVFACHSDEAYSILQNSYLDNYPKDITESLANIKYIENYVTLHTDDSILPKKERSRASWNYLLDDLKSPPTVTYYMNRLQRYSPACNTAICVSLNQDNKIHSEKILHQVKFSHPQIDNSSNKAAATINKLNGANNIYFAGAYLGYGFHEDGARSAVNVAKLMGYQECI